MYRCKRKERNLKQVASLFLVFSMFLAVPKIHVFAYSEEEYEDMYEAVYQEYVNDVQYQMMVADYGEEYGISFLKDVTERNLSENSMVQTRGGGGNICYQSVTNIMQTNGHNCGSTTTLQTLYGLGSASSISGTTNASKIATLDKQYNVDSQGSMYVYQVVDALNKNVKFNTTYTYKVGTSMTQSGFEGSIALSLTCCRPVILHAKTRYLSYYGGLDLRHYLSLDYFNRTTKTVRIVDCINNSDYYGIHTNVPVSEAYKAISAESDRYLIY